MRKNLMLPMLHFSSLFAMVKPVTYVQDGQQNLEAYFTARNQLQTLDEITVHGDEQDNFTLVTTPKDNDEKNYGEKDKEVLGIIRAYQQLALYDPSRGSNSDVRKVDAFMKSQVGYHLQTTYPERPFFF